jgi:Cof subfamily protein (haloacid dehalogenase superfamily)
MVGAAATIQPPFRMVALDMDGTLLNRKHEASSAAVETLRELHAAGVVVALCSGRSQVAMYPTARLLQLPEVPLVCFNGALGLRCTAAFLSGQEAEPHELFTTAVPAEAARAVLAHAAARGELVQYYAGEFIHVACKTDAHVKLTQEYKALTGVAAHVYEQSYESAVARVTPYKMLIMTRDVDATLDAARSALPTTALHLIRGTPPFFVECLHPAVNKGEGLRRLCGVLGIAPSQVVAFGDGDNDLEFIQLAGLGIAMANARQLLKDAADAVTEFSNDEDGVAHALRNLMRDGQFGTAAAAAEAVRAATVPGAAPGPA